MPADRMKGRREHRVPLSPRCFDILARTKETGAGSAYVFPGRSGEKPLSNTVFLKALRRIGLAITAHGFPSPSGTGSGLPTVGVICWRSGAV